MAIKDVKNVDEQNTQQENVGKKMQMTVDDSR